MSDFSRSGGVCTTTTTRREMGSAVRERIRTGTETSGRTETRETTGMESSTTGLLLDPLDLEVHRDGTNDPICTTDRHIAMRVRFFKIYKISSFPLIAYHLILQISIIHQVLVRDKIIFEICVFFRK